MMYDIFLDFASYSIRYGLLSWVTLALTILALLKNRKLRKRINRFLPSIFQTEQDSEVKDYVQNQHIIMQNQRVIAQNQRVIMRQLGVEGEWVGTIETSSNTDQQNSKRLFSLSQVALSRQFIRRNQKMRDYLRKLGSRKFQSFVIGFITQLFILFKLDEGLYVNEIAAGGLILTTIVYIYIEGSVDKARGNTSEPNYNESDDVAA